MTALFIPLPIAICAAQGVRFVIIMDIHGG